MHMLRMNCGRRTLSLVQLPTHDCPQEQGRKGTRLMERHDLCVHSLGISTISPHHRVQPIYGSRHETCPHSMINAITVTPQYTSEWIVSGTHSWPSSTSNLCLPVYRQQKRVIISAINNRQKDYHLHTQAYVTQTAVKMPLSVQDRSLFSLLLC